MIGNVQPAAPPLNQWKNKFPSILTGILSPVQFILTIVIIGCEVGSILIDMVTATIYVGLWASLFFTIAWISQAATSCCCRGRGCATYTLIIELISMFFAACVIGFDSYYIIYPTTCFFPSSVCNSTGVTRGLFYTTANFNNIKIPLIKGQLAAGAVMFVLCLVYIIVYLITTVRVHRAKRPPNVHPQQPNSFQTVPTVSNGVLTAPPPNSHLSSSAANNIETRITPLVCPTCNATFNMSISKRPLI